MAKCMSATDFMSYIMPLDGANSAQIEQLKKMREVSTHNNLARFEAARIKAIETLIHLLEDPRPTIQLRAAEVILEKATDFEKVKEIEAKLQEFTDRLKNQEGLQK